MSPPTIDFIALQTWLAACAKPKAKAQGRTHAEKCPEPRS